MAEPTAQRLTRLLAMLGYLAHNQAVPLDEMAAHFGVSTEQILSDIDLLWVSGTPGYMPGDLLDFSADELDGGLVRLTEDQGMAVPVRLSTAEAVAVQVALASLAHTVAPQQRPAVERVLEKVTEATGVAAAGAVHLDVGQPPDAVAADTLREAAQERGLVSFQYVSAAGRSGTRRVEPWRVFYEGGAWFLAGWSQGAEGPRTFRLDRMAGVRRVAGSAQHDPDPTAGLSTFNEVDAPEACLELSREVRWLADEIPVVSRIERDDGGVEIRVRVVEPAWLRSLVFAHPGALRVVEPAWLRDQLREQASATLRNYTDTAMEQA